MERIGRAGRSLSRRLCGCGRYGLLRLCRRGRLSRYRLGRCLTGNRCLFRSGSVVCPFSSIETFTGSGAGTPFTEVSPRR